MKMREACAHTDLDPRQVDILLKLPDVCQQVGFGKTAIYAMMKYGNFPEPIKIGPASRWSQMEIQEWILKQKAARRAA